MGPEHRGLPQHQIGQFADFDAADDVAHAVRHGRVDGVFGDVASDPQVVVVDRILRQRPALLRNALNPYIPYDTAGTSGTTYLEKGKPVRDSVEIPAWAKRPVQDAVRVAALTAVAGAILNLDAFLTKQ